jgi:hypothetical protein
MSSLKNRWLSVTLGGVALAGLAALPASMRAYGEENDHNPHIHHAIDALHEAHDEIANASHDFHGQRREALEVLDHAIQKLDEIKDYDR